MPMYRVIHGSLTTPGRVVAVGEVVELSESFVSEVDPRGVTFARVVETPKPAPVEAAPNPVTIEAPKPRARKEKP